MKKIIALLLALVMVFALCACGGKTETTTTDAPKTDAPKTDAPKTDAPKTDAPKTDAPSAPAEKKVLVVGAAAEPATLDPGAAGFSGANAPAQMAIFNTLIGWDSDAGAPTPLIAESWEWPDELTCRFHLRDDVYSQSGHHITANDVKFTYDRIAQNPSIGNSIKHFDMDASKAVDDYTFDLKLHNPNYNALSGITLSVCGILCEEDLKSAGDDFARKPIGTGPYKMTEWKTGESITLTRWDEYWGDAPYYDEIILKPIPDSNARILALQSGDIDFAENLGSASIPTLQADPNLVIVEGEVNQTQTLWFNCDDGPLSDVRVRHALEYAIDKEAVGKSVFMGYGQAAWSIFNTFSDQFRMPPEPRTYNPEKAKELLKEAGYENGFNISMACYENVDFANMLQSIAYYWSQIGVNAEVNVMEKGSFFGLIYSDDFQIYCIHQIGTDAMVRTASLTSDVPRVSGNQTKFANARVDELLKTINASQDKAKNNEMYKEVADIMYEEAHFIHIWESKWINGAKPGISNVKMDSISNMQYHLLKGE